MTNDPSITPQSPDFSKRYWLFAWDNEFSRWTGGMDDFIASFDTIDDAKNRNNLESLSVWGMAHIFDSHSRMKILFITNKYDIAWAEYV